MIRPGRLQHVVERMDEPCHDPAVLESDLRQIEAVNRWLGGRRAVLHALGALLGKGTSTVVLDVGCGGGDLPRAIVAFARGRGARVRVVAVDRHSQTIGIARRRTVGLAEIDFIRADGLVLPFADRSFDVALMSLTLHHFEAGARTTVLRELGRVAQRSVIINELERCWPNYLGARLLAATVWRRNPLARHDGPVSVLRAFTRRELAEDLRAAGLTDGRVERRFFHRLVATASPPANPAAASTL